MTNAPAVLVRDGFPPLLPQDRAPGRHLSDVTRSLCAGLGDFVDDPDSEPPYQLMQLGLTMEWGLAFQLSHHFPGRYLRTWDTRFECWKFGLQLQIDGIWMNIDLLNIGQEVVWAVEDIKLTRKSSRHGQDSPKWREAWMRVKGYCWGIGARVGRLWISHLFDYSARGGGDAICRVWERRWDTKDGEQELADNWEVIVRHERQMTARGE